VLQVTINVPFPEGKLVYDYVFEPARMKWGAWLDRLEQKPVADSDADYSNIIVPTGKRFVRGVQFMATSGVFLELADVLANGCCL
jgi:hypothetical protein